jgi:hypothetical protein
VSHQQHLPIHTASGWHRSAAVRLKAALCSAVSEKPRLPGGPSLDQKHPSRLACCGTGHSISAGTSTRCLLLTVCKHTIAPIPAPPTSRPLLAFTCGTCPWWYVAAGVQPCWAIRGVYTLVTPRRAFDACV